MFKNKKSTSDEVLFYFSCLTSHTIRRIDFAELFVGIDLGDVVKGTFTDCYFVLVGEVIEGDLIPIAFFAAGGVIYLFDMLCEACAVCVVPI